MPNDPKIPTRRDLQKIFKDQRLVVAIQQLFELVPSNINIESVDAGNGQASATMALDMVESLRSLVEFNSLSPSPLIQNNSNDVSPPLQPTPPSSYGSFLRTTDTTPSLVDTAYAIEFESTEMASGTWIGATPSQIFFSSAGVYRLEVNFKLLTSTTTLKNVWFWARQNGADINNSAIITSIETTSQYIAVSQSHSITISPGDYIEIMWASNNTDVTLEGDAATSFSPASPSVKLIINQIQ